MEEKLVTVAIHTYERALIVKGILESEGIQVCLHNVNLIQPVISAGVRVRINERDLPAALSILEGLNFPDECVTANESVVKSILVPVDFSMYSLKAARLAVHLAHDLQTETTLLHTYYSPMYAGGMPISDAFAFDDSGKELVQKQMNSMHEHMDELKATLLREMKEGQLPECRLKLKFREGVPEEQILTYSKRHPQQLIVLGTHGKGFKEGDLLGSVTADVIERSNVPVFAFPVDMPMESMADIKHIGYITNYEQRDLIAFDAMMQLLKPYRFKVYFLHLSSEAETWDEIKLSGIKSYFEKQYPDLESTYCVIRGDNLIQTLDEFIQERTIDVIAMMAQKRSIIARLFNSSLANKMLFHTNTPVLLLRG